MKKEVSPCEHGYYGLCPRCVVEERNALRARVAELEARIAEAEKQEPVGVVCVGEDMSYAFTPHAFRLMEVGDYQVYTRPLPAPVAAVPDVSEIVVADGLALVPCEATVAMRNAFYNALHQAIFDGEHHQFNIAYRAMLAAKAKGE